MWIFTDKGFYSIVHKIGSPADDLTVRTRVRADLERLKADIPAAGPIQLSGGSDYPYRCVVARADFGAWLSAQALALDYHNFKGHIGQVNGAKREAVYHRVWADLLELENLPE